MFIAYVVMLQNSEYTQPEICYGFGGESLATYDSEESAKEFIEYMVGRGYSAESYFVAKIERI